MSKFGTQCFLLLCLVVAGLWFGTPDARADECSSVAQSNTPIAAPPANAGSAANFSGVWSGIFSVPVGIRANERHPASFCGQLHVSVKDSNRATVVYCVSEQPELRMMAGCSVNAATISGNQLTFTTPANFAYSFTLGGGGTLTGQYASKARAGAVYVTEFRRTM